ncbi:MAG: class I SAM-dependent methyltransferase [Chitinophagaceae bacterium]|nr:class I SAM-dependent methyltransferase [Chitinophagaceae bacterium]
MKHYIIRYLKFLFIYLKLHKFFRLFSGFFLNLFYLSELSVWINQNKKIKFNDFPSKWNYQKRYTLYTWVLQNENLTEIPINYLEFGVAGGESFRWFLDQNKNQHSRFYGFDTFTGLPEDFGSYKKGTFDTSMKAPELTDPRGKFFQGLFQQTLPSFLPELDIKKRNVIMLDADLYSATLYTLTALAPFIKKDDIIFFDEFAVPTHEFKAFYDFTQSYSVNLQLIASASNYYFAAFKIL